MSDAVAIVGLACRLPHAFGAEELWTRIVRGELCIDELPSHDGEVGARGVLAGTDRFDARLFGVSDVEARGLDPQHRLFLELCWHALEDGAVDPGRTHDAIAVFGACSHPVNPEAPRPAGSLADDYQASLLTAPDFLATRVSHRLDLRGESMLVQTGCSSSLVAIHMACQSVLSGQSDAALAGGVSIASDQSRGYEYQEGMIASPEGRCRPFDAAASGAVPGSGGGVVLLKPLDVALEDGDAIRAVIIGSALNNDGASKASFMAPSVAGQAEVIATALADAGIEPRTVGLVEAHGTATALGDQVEFAALREVFGRGPSGDTIALGSLKGAFGHLDRAAGVAGLIKAVLCLERGMLPPSAGSVTPHPDLDMNASPFRLLQAAQPWRPAGGGPRRAAVSSFGVGGTNAHVVLEQAPSRAPRTPRADPGPQLVTVSAATPASLHTIRADLAEHLEHDPHAALEEVARTRNLGRAQLPWRTAAAGADPLTIAAPLRDGAHSGRARSRRIVLAFPGHGAGAPRAGSELYRWSPVYREAIDECARVLEPILGLDVRASMYGRAPDDKDPLARLSLAQPALLATEYALASVWRSWGLEPDVVIGHSMGEVTAAMLAGVFDLPDALRFVTERGRALDAAAGAMLQVTLGEHELLELLPGVAELGGGQLARAVRRFGNSPGHRTLRGSPRQGRHVHAAAAHRLRRALARAGAAPRRGADRARRDRPARAIDPVREHAQRSMDAGRARQSQSLGRARPAARPLR